MVCSEFRADQARSWIAGGDVAELAEAADVGMVDIGRGHWPMFSTTVELFEQYGVERIRQIGKHAWIISRLIDGAR